MLQTFQNESLVVDTLLLNYFKEVLVDFVVTDGPQSTHLTGLPFSLHKGESYLLVDCLFPCALKFKVYERAD